MSFISRSGARIPHETLPAVLLLNFEGDYTDESPYNHSSVFYSTPGVNPELNTGISSTQAKFGTSSHVERYNITSGPGFSTRIRQVAPQGSEFTFDGDFTIAFWMYPEGETGSYLTPLACCEDRGSAAAVIPNSGWVVSYRTPSAGQMGVTFEAVGSIGGLEGLTSATGSGVYMTNLAWNHVEITRRGTTTYLFVNGALADSKTTLTGTVGSGAESVTVGGVIHGSGLGLPNDYLLGYIDSVLLLKGLALHTASFTPPTAAYHV